jgi:hypothetical protein
MSKEEQIEVITYEQDRLYFFVDQVSLAQKKYDRLFKTFKDAPYLSEGAQFLSDAGRELQFYKDVVEMLDTKSELDKKQQKDLLLKIKAEIREKAVYMQKEGMYSYILLRVVNGIIINHLRDLEEKKHSE